MFAGTSGGVVTVGGAAVIVVAIRRCNGCMFAGTSGSVVGVGGAT